MLRQLGKFVPKLQVEDALKRTLKLADFGSLQTEPRCDRICWNDCEENIKLLCARRGGPESK